MTVSVILPNYNYGHYLPIALEAILSQSLSPLEILVLDDASTDGSVEIIKTYQKKFPLIKLITDTENKGVVSRINQGIDLAQGTYLAFCAADDEVMPGFFEKSIELLEKHPHAALCASRYCFFYHDAPSKLHCFPTLLSQKKWDWITIPLLRHLTISALKSVKHHLRLT